MPVPAGLRLQAHKSAAAAAVVLTLTAGGLLASAMRPSRTVPITRPESAQAAPLPVSTPPAEAIATGAAPIVGPLVEAESYSVEAGSFRTITRARTITAQAVELGLPAFMRRGTGPWHHVIVGPYASREEALDAQQRLEGIHLRDTMLVARAPGPSSGNERRVSAEEPLTTKEGLRNDHY